MKATYRCRCSRVRGRGGFFEDCIDHSMQMQGKYEQHCVHHDEGLTHKAVEWVCEHAFVKGEPNMRAQSICEWVNNHLLSSSQLPPYFPCSISLHTVVCWLHHLGFSHKKGVYSNGYEREDKNRKEFLKVMNELRMT